MCTTSKTGANAVEKAVKGYNYGDRVSSTRSRNGNRFTFEFSSYLEPS